MQESTGKVDEESCQAGLASVAASNVARPQNVAAPTPAAVEFVRALLGIAPASTLDQANAALLAVAATTTALQPRLFCADVTAANFDAGA